MRTVYRIIKIEGEDEEVGKQMGKSVAEGVYYVGPTMKVTVKDRDNDPNKNGFFDGLTDMKAGFISQDHLNKVGMDHYNKSVKNWSDTHGKSC